MELEITNNVVGGAAVNVAINNVTYSMQLSLLDSITWLSCAALAGTNSSVGCSINCSNEQAIHFLGETTQEDELCFTPTSVSMQLADAVWTSEDFVAGIGDGPGAMPNGSNPVVHQRAQGVLGLSSVSSQSTDNEFHFSRVMDRLDNFSIFLAQTSTVNKHGQQAQGASVAPMTSSHLVLNGVDEELIQRQQLTAHAFALSPPKTHMIPGEWSIPLKAMVMGSQWISRSCDALEDCTMRFDTRVPFLTLSGVDDQLSSLRRALHGCSYNAVQSRFECRAQVSRLPVFSVVLGSSASEWTRFHLAPSEYADDLGDGKLAVYVEESIIAGYTLGDKFLRKYPSLYQVNQGITLYCAPASCQRDDGSVVVLWNSSSMLWYESRRLWRSLVCLVFAGVGLVLVGRGLVRLREARSKRPHA